jgi:hypothetical protein
MERDRFDGVLRRLSILCLYIVRPPKGMCWGHAKNPHKKLEVFFDAYFERVESQGPATLVLAWKESALPKADWPDAFLGPDKQMLRQFLFIVMGGRVMFPMGIVFPLAPTDPASFEFLSRFSADAPFKMSAKHFQVGVVHKNGNVAWRKPDAEIAAKLEKCRFGSLKP